MASEIVADVTSNYKVEFPHAYVRDIELSVGDDISVFEYSDHESIAKICKIYWNLLNRQVILSIQWYFKKRDTKVQTIIEKCSEIELFLSNFFMEIELSNVNGKVRVFQLEEIFELDEIDDDVYFTRAKWDVNTSSLIPSMSLWKNCHVCYDVINTDNPFKVCTGCGQLYHEDCLKKNSAQSCESCSSIL